MATLHKDITQIIASYIFHSDDVPSMCADLSDEHELCKLAVTKAFCYCGRLVSDVWDDEYFELCKRGQRRERRKDREDREYDWLL